MTWGLWGVDHTAGANQSWFHISPHDLPEGTVLTPGGGESPYLDTYAHGGFDGVQKHVWMDRLENVGGWKGNHVYRVEPSHAPRLWDENNPSMGWVAPSARIVRKYPESILGDVGQAIDEHEDDNDDASTFNSEDFLYDWDARHHTAARLAMPYDFAAPHGRFQMPVERNEHGHIRVHRGIVVPRAHLSDPRRFQDGYGLHWSTNEQISQALADPAEYGENPDDVGLLMSGWYNPDHGTHPDPDPITGGAGYNEHEQEITMRPGTPIHVDRVRWKHPDWNYDRWEDLNWSPGTKKARNMTAAVTVYTKPNCPQCTMTKKQLERLGIEHQTIDVTTDPEAHAYVTGLGYQQAPVVVVGDGERHWGGFSPDKLKGLIE